MALRSSAFGLRSGPAGLEVFCHRRIVVESLNLKVQSNCDLDAFFASSKTLLKRSAPRGLKGRSAEDGVFKHLK